MYRLHLALVSLRDLAARKGRTVFLILGVAVGTGALAFLLAVRGGLDRLVRRGLDDLAAAIARHDDLAARKEAALAGLPVNRLTVRPRTGGRERIGPEDVARMRVVAGVRAADPVAIIFPVTMGIQADDFAIDVMGARFPLLEREVTTFITVYGVPDAYLDPGDVLPGKRFELKEGAPVPVLLPASWLDYLTTIKDETMKERFAELVSRRLTEQAKRSKRFAGEVEKRFGPDFLSQGLFKAAVEMAFGQLLDQLDRTTIPDKVKLVLYPGIEPGTSGTATAISGYSDRIPSGGISVPLPYIDRWNKQYADDTAGFLGSVFGKDSETSFSEVAVATGGFDATVAVHEALVKRGYKVESAVDDLRPILDEIEASEAEAGRLRAEAARMEDLGGAVARGTVVVSALLFLLGGAVVANGLALSVLEQRKRIGILRAVGASRADILMVFLLEAAAVGAAGAALGLGLAAGSLRVFGASLAQGLGAASATAGASPAAVFALGSGAAAAVAVLGVSVSVAAGFFPALRAALIRPVEVLK